LFRRLNSYSKQHALYRALKAFGQIPKSLFILQVIDDPVLRQAIEKQMDRSSMCTASRGPSQRATRGNSPGGKRRPGDGRSLQAAHQELHYLLELSLSVAEVGRDYGYREPRVDAVAHGLTVAWRHLNLLGEYFLGRKAAGQRRGCEYI
jgi:hypothetical protein